MLRLTSFLQLFILLFYGNDCFGKKILTQNDFRESVIQIRNLKPEKFNRSIEIKKKEITKYLFYKKGYCEGEFSSIVLAANKGEQLKEVKASNKRLSKSEKSQCLNSLLLDQIKYTRALFYAQKEFLKYFDKVRLQKLDETNEAFIKKIKDEIDLVNKKKYFKKKRKRK